jgi:lysophospholipase L1-like esterase
MKKRKMLILASFTLYLLSGGEVAFGQTQWVGTWVTAQQLTETNNNPPSPGLANNTLRQVIRVTLSGSQIRVLFSNQYGNSTLVMKEVHIASSSGGSTINISTDATLAFNGSDSVSIPAGQTVWSDTLSYSLTALSNYAISICFGDAPPDVTGHPGSRTTSYLQSGNAVTNASISGSTTDHWYILAGIDVVTDGTCAAVVTLGDSITDGRGSTTNGNDRWPDALANRLQADPNTNKVAVLNQGIGGNAVVSGGLGPTALSRFDRDVIDQSGVKWCIVLEGVNDIGGSQSATNIINAYNEFIDKAHANNIFIYGVPILPFGGSQYDSADHQATRDTVNDWIRTSGRFDAVIDMDAAVRNSSNPNRLASAYDSGDGLHLNPAGYRKMADSIPLSLLTPVEGTPLPTTVPTPAPTDVHFDCSNAPGWDPGAVYENAGMRVVYNGNLYENNWYSSGQNPEENSGEYDVWTLIGPCDSQTTPAPTTVPTATPVDTPVPTAQPGNIGDVNDNGAIDIVDALLVAQYYVGLDPQNFNAGNADSNCNGTIDIVDALLIAQYYVGLIEQFCTLDSPI